MSDEEETTKPDTEEARNRRRKIEMLVTLGTPRPVAERMAEHYKPDAFTQSVLDGMQARAGLGCGPRRGIGRSETLG